MRHSAPFTTDAEIAAIGHGLIDKSLPKQHWTHAAHFAAALWVLHCRPDIDAPAEMPHLIRAYNEATGVANTHNAGYHETITQASLRAARSWLAAHPGKPLFAVCNALMASPLGRPDWLLEYWSREALFSPAARIAWLPPDLCHMPF